MLLSVWSVLKAVPTFPCGLCDYAFGLWTGDLCGLFFSFPSLLSGQPVWAVCLPIKVAYIETKENEKFGDPLSRQGDV